MICWYKAFPVTFLLAAGLSLQAQKRTVTRTDSLYISSADTAKPLAIRHADRLSFADIEKAIVDYSVRGRDGQLRYEELTGGTFTITNGGIFGSMLSTPILNPPQSAILGMHAIKKRPMVIDDQIVIRPMMYLALSYDHRIVDGKEAVTFLVRVKEALEDPARLVLDL